VNLFAAFHVIPAKAGISSRKGAVTSVAPVLREVLAFAGMTCVAAAAACCGTTRDIL
jgi:hypothetical protein